MNLQIDILSYQRRKPRIHIFTLDRVLCDDVYERIKSDRRLSPYEIIRPTQAHWKRAVAEIESMAADTVNSRLLIMDVRRDFLPKLQPGYNKIVGYNRRDLNRLCYTLLIGDGPLNLFQNGDGPGVFVPMLASRRQDYHPAAFFFDPLIHYEADEQELGMDSTFVVPERLPRRLKGYFTESELNVADARRYFRAAKKQPDVRIQRLKTLAAIYKRSMKKHFPQHIEQFKGWLSKDGIRLASERMNIYPIFFEDWVNDLMEKAANPTD
jgi:hypothetical protein